MKNRKVIKKVFSSITCLMVFTFLIGSVVSALDINYTIQSYRDKNQVGFVGDLLTNSMTLENISENYTLRDGEFIIVDTSNTWDKTRFLYYPNSLYINGISENDSFVTIPNDYVGVHIDKVFPRIRPGEINQIRFTQEVALDAVLDDVQPTNTSEYILPELSLTGESTVFIDSTNLHNLGDEITMTYTFKNTSLDQMEELNTIITAPEGTIIKGFTSNFVGNSELINERTMKIEHINILLNGADVFNRQGKVTSTDVLEITITLEVRELVTKISNYSSMTNASTNHPQYNNGITQSVHGQDIDIEWNFPVSYVLSEGVNNENNPVEYTYGIGVDLFENPTKEGYVFLGWTDENGTIITNIMANESGEKTLYAMWKKEEINLKPSTLPPTSVKKTLNAPQTGDQSDIQLLLVLAVSSILLIARKEIIITKK